jgi:putative pyruvate formate lyase activating enzyme
MPDGKAGTYELMKFLAADVSPNTYVNIMNQYRPCGGVSQFSELCRAVTPAEYHQALSSAQAAGITRLDQRQRRFLLNWQ